MQDIAKEYKSYILSYIHNIYDNNVKINEEMLTKYALNMILISTKGNYFLLKCTFVIILYHYCIKIHKYYHYKKLYYYIYYHHSLLLHDYFLPFFINFIISLFFISDHIKVHHIYVVILLYQFVNFFKISS